MSLFSRRIPAATAAAAVFAGGTLLGLAGAAQADPQEGQEPEAKLTAPARPYGVVTASKLAIRQYPSTDSSIKSWMGHGRKIGLDCKVRAQYINGNTIWYKLRTHDQEKWSSARYIDNHGHVPLCKDKYPSSLNSMKGLNG